MTYTVRWWASWVVGTIGAIAGVLAASAVTPFHPLWLSTDVAATAGLVAAVCAAVATRLPDTGRTPGTREASYLSASVGVLPKDLADKHPEVLVPPNL